MSLAHGELPLAFEGEERSTAGVGDVMQVRSRRYHAITCPVSSQDPACLETTGLSARART